MLVVFWTFVVVGGDNRGSYGIVVVVGDIWGTCGYWDIRVLYLGSGYLVGVGSIWCCCVWWW